MFYGTNFLDNSATLLSHVFSSFRNIIDITSVIYFVFFVFMFIFSLSVILMFWLFQLLLESDSGLMLSAVINGPLTLSGLFLFFNFNFLLLFSMISFVAYFLFM